MWLLSFCFQFSFARGSNVKLRTILLPTVTDHKETCWIFLIACQSTDPQKSPDAWFLFCSAPIWLRVSSEKAAANSLLSEPVRCVSGLKSQLTAARVFPHPVISTVPRKRFSEKLAEDLDPEPWSCCCACARQPLLHVWKAQPLSPLNACSTCNRTELLLYCDITLTSCLLLLASGCIKVLEKETRLRVDGWFVWKNVSSLHAGAQPKNRSLSFAGCSCVRQNQNNQLAASAVATFLWLLFCLIRLILSLASESSSSSSSLWFQMMADDHQPSWTRLYSLVLCQLFET